MTSWCCDICDKTNNIESKSEHMYSKSHKKKEKFSVGVGEYEFIRLVVNRMDYIINNSATDYYIKYFQTYKFRCLFDIETTNGDFVGEISSVKKLKQIVREFGFIHKLTIKVDSSLSNINTSYFLKFRKAMCHIHFFETVSQNPEYVQTHCNDLNNPFHFACCRWFLDNQSP